MRLRTFKGYQHTTYSHIVLIYHSGCVCPDSQAKLQIAIRICRWNVRDRSPSGVSASEVRVLLLLAPGQGLPPRIHGMDGKEGAEAVSWLSIDFAPLWASAHSKEISAIDSDSATYECKLLADDFGGEKVYCKASRN